MAFARFLDSSEVIASAPWGANIQLESNNFAIIGPDAIRNREKGGRPDAEQTDLGANRIELSGNFTGSADDASGQVNELEVFLENTSVFSISNVAIQLSQLTDFRGPDFPFDSVFADLFENSDQVLGSSAGDELRGFAGSDVLEGGGGNDVLFGMEGSDTLNGDAGYDEAVYSGRSNHYSIAIESGYIVVTDRRESGEGQDLLNGIEALSFQQPGDFGFIDVTSLSGIPVLSEEDLRSFIELYIAYFNRAPDANGLNFWGTAFARGTSLDDMARDFITQAETAELYATIDNNRQLVETVYQNVLGRLADQSGVAFWVEQLDNGSTTADRFILEVLRGARSDLKPEEGQAFVNQQLADRAFLENKVNIGGYYALQLGLSDVANARTVMQAFDGSAAGFSGAISFANQVYSDALDAVNGQLLIQYSGASGGFTSFTATEGGPIIEPEVPSFIEIPGAFDAIYYHFIDENAEERNSAFRIEDTDIIGIRFTIEDGLGFLTDVTLEDDAAFFARTHEEFVSALQPGLRSLIDAGILPEGTSLTLDPTIEDFTFLDDGTRSAAIPAVVLAAPGADLTPTGFSRVDDVIGELDIYGRFYDEALENVVPDIVQGLLTTDYLFANSSATTSDISFFGDEDWFRMELEVGNDYFISLSAADNSTLDTFLRIFGSGGAELLVNDDSNGTLNSELSFSVNVSDSYFVSAEAFADSSTGTYIIQATSVPFDISGGTDTQSFLVAGGRSIFNSIEIEGDEDWFAMNLAADVVYQANLTATSESSLDTYLTLLDQNGVALQFNDDSNGTLNSEMVFSVEEDGLYYISAAAFADTSTGSYVLSAFIM